MSAVGKKKFVTKPLKFGRFDVFYKINESTLHAGEVLNGTIELDLQRQVYVTAITVTFYGEITYEVLSTNFKNKHLQSRKFSVKNHKIFEKPSHETAMILENGFYTYEFFVSTEKTLPVSFVGCGSVRSLVYFCEAVIIEILQEKGKDVLVEHTKRKPFLLKTPVVTNGILNHKQLHVEKNVMYVKNVLDTSGVIAACLVLYKHHYCVGENIRFKVEILNCFRKLKLDIALVQHGKISINGSYRLIQLDLVKVTLGEMKSSQCYKAFEDRCIWIPDDSLAPTSLRLIYANHLIQLWYTLMLHVKTWNDKTLYVETPVIIKGHKNKLNGSQTDIKYSRCGTV